MAIKTGIFLICAGKPNESTQSMAGSGDKVMLVIQNIAIGLEWQTVKIYSKLISEVESYLSTECAWVPGA